MLGKSLLLMAGYTLLSILSMCDRCPKDDDTYYDFTSLEISYPSGDNLGANDSLRLIIREADIEYLANVQPSLFPAAYALDCVSPMGAMGKKYPIISFTMRSNAAWDEQHPAGSSLNDLVLLNLTYRKDYTLAMYLAENMDSDLLHSDSYDLLIPPPTSNKTHQLTISIEKENGGIIQATTEEISWE